MIRGSLDVALVFRGNIGEEEGAIAVGTRDISEPTYFSVLNSSDYFRAFNRALPATEYRPEVTDPEFRNYVDPEPILDVSITLDGKEIAFVEAIPPQSFVRVAALLDLGDSPDPFRAASLRLFTYDYSFRFAGGEAIDTSDNGLGIPRLAGGTYCGPTFGSGLPFCDLDIVPLRQSGVINGFYPFGDIVAFTFRPYYQFRGWTYPAPLLALGNGTQAQREHLATHAILRKTVFMKDNYELYDALHSFFEGLGPYPEGQAIVPDFFLDDPGVIPNIINPSQPIPVTRLMDIN